MDALALFIPGRPRPKGSPQVVTKIRGRRLKEPRILTDTKASRLWQMVVKGTALLNYGGPPIEEPVEVFLEFVFVRPKSHWTKRRRLSAAGRRMPIPGLNAGDVDKLARSTLDGLEGVVYANDTRVAWLVSTKRFHSRTANGELEPQGCHARITRMETAE